MIWASDATSARVWFSAGWTQFTGRTQDEELDGGWIDGVHPDDREGCFDAFASAFATRSRFEVRYRLLRADGQYRWVVDRAEARFDDTDRFTGYVGSCVDISEHQELHDREAAYLASMQDGFFVLDHDGVITDVNQRLADIIGSSREELLGSKAPYPWWPTADARELARFEEANSALLERGSGEFDLVFRHQAGYGVPVIVSAASLESSVVGDTRYVCTVKDVSARKLIEEERDELLALEHAARRDAEEARHAVAAALARLDALLEHAPVGFAFVDLDLRFARVNQPMADLVGVPIGAHLGRRVDEVDSDLWREAEGGFRAVLGTGDPILDTEVAAQTAVVPGLERAFLASYYPVRASDGTLLGAGSLLVEITERKQIERAAMLILRASELFSRTRDLADLLDEAVNLPLPDFADSCHLYLDADHESPPTVAIAHVVPGMSERLMEADRRWPLQSDLVFDPDRPNQPALLSVVDDDLRSGFAVDAEHAAIVEEHGVVSAVAVPLIARGHRLGTLMLNYTKISGRRYRAGDVRLAEELARRFAQALDGARLATRERRVQAHLDLLAKVGDLLTVELSADARMQRFVSLAVPDFADLCMLQRREEDGTFSLGHFAISESHHADDAELVAQWPGIPADPDMASVQAAASGRAVLWPEIPESAFDGLGPAGSDLAHALGLRSLLSVPLRGEGPDTYGTVVFLQTRSGRRFESADVPIAEELARRASFAFEHARRYQREQTTAETLQRSLLPAKLPRVRDVEFAARYCPGGEALRVGGDWYDVIPRGDGLVLFAVGDVVGHGLAAASSTGRLRAALQLSGLDEHGAAETLERLNRYLCSLPDAEMATVAVALLDAPTGELRISSAGHPPPLLLRSRPDDAAGHRSSGQAEPEPDDARASFLSGGLGVPLHVSESSEYHEISVRLEAGDVVVVYTDGLVERRGEILDIGLERLRVAARDGPRDLEALADHLLGRLLPDEGPTDDVAILLLRSTRGPEGFELEVRARPDELAGVRHRLQSWLESLGLPEPAIDEVVVAVNEAATNVVEHAYGLAEGRLTVSGELAGADVVVEVRDSGRWQARDPRPHRGRGFTLMGRLMDSVEVGRDAAGTTVTLRRRIDPTRGLDQGTTRS